MQQNRKPCKSSVNPEEVEYFSSLSGEWWKENGAFKPLHMLNPCRLTFIRNEVTEHFKVRNDKIPYKDINFLDVGCGGGILCEPLARLGGNVTGIDASAPAIKAAACHAAESGLDIEYLCETAENLVKKKKRYDVVTALEIIEHADNPAEFVKTLSGLIKPGGLLFISTVNRTVLSYAAAIIGAEYVLRLVPKGTHDWNKFLKPHEVTDYAENAELAPVAISGMVYNPAENSFVLKQNNTAINYIACFKKA